MALVNNNNMQTINQNISDRWDIQETVNIYSDILIVFRIKLMKAGAKADLRLWTNALHAMFTAQADLSKERVFSL